VQKLKERKIRWIIREKEKGSSSKAIAEVQHITVQRVYQIYRQYRATGKVPELKNAGRPGKELTDMEKSIIVSAYRKYRINEC